MPTVDQNLQIWNVDYDWIKGGEEWSWEWGGSEAQWFGAIFPRIHAFLPTGTILEIAPGFGRWTNRLRSHCEHLIVVDLSEQCIAACRERFAAHGNITCHVNDGRSLAMVPDDSIDFVFSFDSLVHAEADIIQSYLDQLGRKLRPNGVGFIHHSNLGQYQRRLTAGQRLPRKVRDFLIRRGALEFTIHGRAFSMTAPLFERYCEQSGLQCISQELVNWASRRLIDCFSSFTPRGSTWARRNEVLENHDFMKEVGLIRRLARLYSTAYSRR